MYELTINVDDPEKAAEIAASLLRLGGIPSGLHPGCNYLFDTAERREWARDLIRSFHGWTCVELPEHRLTKAGRVRRPGTRRRPSAASTEGERLLFDPGAAVSSAGLA